MEKISAYLKRLGYTGTPKQDFDTLHDLHRLHLMTIPYENLDIMREIPLSLEVDDIYDKVIRRGRGGYCFELNALFTWLLTSLGFGVTVYAARFLRNETEIPMRRHRVLNVACKEGNFLCDVGVGGVVPRMPIPIAADRVSEQYGETYVLRQEDFLGYVLYEWKHEAWHRIYSFTQEPQLDQDFITVSYFCEKHPESFFKTQDMVHIFTEDGRKSVAGREVRLFSPDGVQVLHPATEAAYNELLEIHFGIKL